MKSRLFFWNKIVIFMNYVYIFINEYHWYILEKKREHVSKSLTTRVWDRGTSTEIPSVLWPDWPEVPWKGRSWTRLDERLTHVTLRSTVKGTSLRRREFFFFLSFSPFCFSDFECHHLKEFCRSSTVWNDVPLLKRRIY